MAITARLQVRQSQQLVMTPQLLQSIRLLQFDQIELAAFVAREVEANPLLDWAGEDGAPEAAPSSEAVPSEATSSEVTPREVTSGADAPSPTGGAEAEGGTPEEASGEPADDGPFLPRSASSGPVGDGTGDVGDWCAVPMTLADHLGSQAALAFRDPLERALAEAIVHSLDDDGYLRRSLAEMAGALGVPQVRLAGVLAGVQGFDPPGIAARSLPECLALQLAARNRLDPAMATILDHLDLLARRDFAALRRLSGLDEEDLAGAVAEIRACDPRPGSRFDGAPLAALVPDVSVRARADGSWSVELNPEALPRVLVDRAYHAVVARACRGEADRLFLSEALARANWLTRSLDSRAQTVLKVAAEIVRQQDGFLMHGVAHLRPLNLKAVAEAIGMHESTVSRVTTAKAMMTPRGLFPFKYFFTTAIAGTAEADSHSAEAVRHRIRRLIEAENAGDVLSDDALVEALRAEGIDIARRTVAKYREAMGIASSVQRRRERKVALRLAG